MLPLPSFKVPSQTANPVRVAIVLPPLFVDVMQAIVRAILSQTGLSASLHLSRARLNAICFRRYPNGPHIARSETSLAVAVLETG